MAEHRFFRDSFDNDQGLSLSANEAQHHLKVLRLTTGKIITVTTSDKHYQCEVIAIHNHHLELMIRDIFTNDSQSHPAITLVQGLPKQDKMSDIIQCCTEMGVSNIIPVLMERSVVKLDDKAKRNKTQRWQKVLDGANQQAQRSHVATLSDIQSLKQWLETLGPDSDTDCRLVPWEEASLSLKRALEEYSKLPTHTTVVIGPEGGISAKEIELLENHGFVPVSLGKSILRTEHAGFATLAQLSYAFSS